MKQIQRREFLTWFGVFLCCLGLPIGEPEQKQKPSGCQAVSSWYENHLLSRPVLNYPDVVTWKWDGPDGNTWTGKSTVTDSTVFANEGES